MTTAPDLASLISSPQDIESVVAQMVVYARDLNSLLSREREKSSQIASAYEQLVAYARDLRAAVDTERMRAEQLESAYLDTLRRLGRASQFKDPETGAHIQRVSHSARALASGLGLSAEEAELISRAAPMHDVGKIGVPDVILLKEGPLTEQEWVVMKRHSAFGASLLKGSGSRLLEVAREIALTHHERWDGTGYPQGLEGAAIPLSGRIVMLADVYDALRSKRPYKPAFTHDQTRRIILEGDNRTRPCHFDPQLLEVFREIHTQLDEIHERLGD